MGETLLYNAQPGDTLWTVAVRFGVLPEDIESLEPLPDERKLIDPEELLLIPNRLVDTSPDNRLIPDSELVFSPHVIDFDVEAFIVSQGGYLSRFQENLGGGWHSGAEIVDQIARDNSINPRIILALLEYRSGWVTDPTTPSGNLLKYPMGFVDDHMSGLQRQLIWSVNELGNGYYSWRAGTMTDVTLKDGADIRLAPALNAGTVALQYFFSLDRSVLEWENDLGSEGFIATYTSLFGDPWAYEHPLYEPYVEQPHLILPFLPGHVWAFTGGPHGAWERDSAWAALDFAPAMTESGCAISSDWVVAAAPGLVVRSDTGIVVLDLDGDGLEQSGWALLYLHVAKNGRVEEGELLEEGDLIGHPSCEGGIASGTHIHIARKYNGEWILADGPLPFELSEWIAVAGSKPYQGALIKDDQIVYACPCATQETLIKR
jgi:LasA protease